MALSRASRLTWGSARPLADRVAGVVWAAGDRTAFCAKTGGFADEQAYVAAADIEAAAGASVQERPFDPVLQ